MKTSLKVCYSFTVLFFAALLFSSFESAGPRFPYRKAGLTDRQAAAHLLSRFTYGAERGEVDEVAVTGLEKWFAQQLKGGLYDTELDSMLSKYKDIDLSNAEVEMKFPREDKAQRRTFFREFINQKILRAVYTRNQLREVLTDFWFNHFNVSITKNRCAPFVPAYERDVIRPNVTGKFSDLLMATAKSPAMLAYLDNARSKRKDGLNENYAREVMELHTLGVDGGYTQNDVTQAARVLTGWTIAPIEKEFVFVPKRHDGGEKRVLGHRFPAGGGYEEGRALLEMLAKHPSTAKFISRKLAVRFVSDNPPTELINRMAGTFTKSGGDVAQVLTTMVSAKEFWDKAGLGEKTKSPLELVASAARSLDAKITQPYPLASWISKMGQKLYYYQAPTGFPDRGQYWINTGALLSRMNFGLALAGQRIPGVRTDLNGQDPAAVGKYIGSPDFQKR